MFMLRRKKIIHKTSSACTSEVSNNYLNVVHEAFFVELDALETLESSPIHIVLPLQSVKKIN